METQKDWYAVYTRPRWEKKVTALLSKQQVENFCPLNREIRQWADRKKIVYEPLFSCYVFVHASEPEFLTIRKTDGILNFVYWLGSPARIRKEEIEAIRSFLEEHDHVQVEKMDVNVTDHVRITKGPFVHRNGSVMEVKKKTIKVSLPSLGYALIAEVAKESIEVIPLVKNSISNESVYYENFG